MAEGRAGRSRDLERLITFVDAVVAIAITLLVLPLVDVATEVGDGSVEDLLREHRAQIGAFLLSFVVIAALWMAQHRTLRTVVAQDTLIARMLLVWTLTIVLLPFPTALVAEAGDQAATKAFYIGLMALSAACLALMSWVIGRRPALRDSDQTPDTAVAVATCVAFLVALAVALLVPATGYYPLLVLLLPDRLVRAWRRRRRSGPHPARRVGE